MHGDHARDECGLINISIVQLPLSVEDIKAEVNVTNTHNHVLYNSKNVS